MPWKKDVPTSPGLYWYRKGGAAEICEITPEPVSGASLVRFIGEAEAHLAADEHAEWSSVATWSERVPSKPGIYLFRGADGIRACEITLQDGTDQSWVRATAQWIGTEEPGLASLSLGYWSGPLHSPD
jgi:hypothetical protein